MEYFPYLSYILALRLLFTYLFHFSYKHPLWSLIKQVLTEFQQVNEEDKETAAHAMHIPNELHYAGKVIIITYI